MPEPRRVAVVTLVVALVKGAALWLFLHPFWEATWMSHVIQDLRTWRGFFESAQAGLVPYVDFTKEYPVGAGLFYWAMSRFVDAADLRQTALVHGLWMLVADVINAGLTYVILCSLGARRPALWTLALALNPTSLLLGPFRFESVVVTFVLLGYLCHRRGRLDAAVALWALGCSLKWFPAFFIAAQEYRALTVERRWSRWWRGTFVFAIVTALVNLPFVLMALRAGSLRTWSHPYLFHLERPLYWDTVLGVWQLWLGPLSAERYGSIWTLGLVFVALFAWPRERFEFKAVRICLAAIVLNRIYSTQFHLWFYPLLVFGIVQEDRGARRLAWTAAMLDLFNVLVYPISFTGAVGEMGGFAPFLARARGGFWTTVFSGAILLRSAGLVVLAAAMRRSRASSP